jgi:hypothetical protein
VITWLMKGNATRDYDRGKPLTWVFILIMLLLVILFVILVVILLFLQSASGRRRVFRKSKIKIKRKITIKKTIKSKIKIRRRTRFRVSQECAGTTRQRQAAGLSLNLTHALTPNPLRNLTRHLTLSPMHASGRGGVFRKTKIE